MKRASLMIKPASSLCNLRCEYCFYCDVAASRENASFGVMQEELIPKLIENVCYGLENGDALHVAFQGGESTLTGLAYFLRRFDDLQKYPNNGKIWNIIRNKCFWNRRQTVRMP